MTAYPGGQTAAVANTDCEPFVVKVPRRTETGDAPVWQGATRENTGSM